MQQMSSGKWTARNPDGSDHHCWKRPEPMKATVMAPKQLSAVPPRPSLVRPSAHRIHATAEQILRKVQSPLVQQHEFCVRAVIHWGPNQLKCLTTIRPIDEPSDGAMCDPRHAIFFGRNDSLDDIHRKMERWFNEHPDGMV